MDLSEIYSLSLGAGRLINLFVSESRHYFQNDKMVTIFETVYTESISQMIHNKRGSGNRLIGEFTNTVKESTKCRSAEKKYPELCDG